ncbi:MAG: RDD family protein [Sedimentisphaerales bacterium]|nr:RDD family protein [Sedimentisphaerales bacterium]
MEFLPIISGGKRVYAGFWKRFCAGWVDVFVILPLAYLFIWIESFDKNIAILITIPSTALFSMYHVYFNVRFGGTLGKLAVGIRVAKPDGTKIGWPEAWKRSAVDLAFGLLTLCVEVWALTQVNGEQYSATAFVERMRLLQSYYPSWFYIVTISQNIWIWSEVVVLLFNKRKRALHDFIAGTVVIHKEFAEQQAGAYGVPAFTQS